MTTNVETLERALQGLKQALNECAASLNKECAQLAVEKSLLDRSQRRQALRVQDFHRNKAAIARVMEALSKTESIVPRLLSKADAKLLQDPSKSPENDTIFTIMGFVTTGFLIWFFCT
jgi:hypothetical protein